MPPSQFIAQQHGNKSNLGETINNSDFIISLAVCVCVSVAECQAAGGPFA